MRKSLTVRGIEALKPPIRGRLHKFDAANGLAVRVTPTGHKSFVVIKRVGGVQRWITLGSVRTEALLGELTLAEARVQAAEIASAVRQGRDPRRTRDEQSARLFEGVVNTFIDKYAKRKNRRWLETQRVFQRYVLPEWKGRLITDIRRRDVVALLDKIEDRKIKGPKGRGIGGQVTADHTLAAIRKLFNWYAPRDDEFVSPIVPGMRRSRPVARDRVLTDLEIHQLWQVLDGLGLFGSFVKVLFLTAQRREEVAGMRRSEIDHSGLWTIPADRYKTKRPNLVPLPDAALAILRGLPRIDGSDLFFTTTGHTPFSGFGKAKRNLDKKLADLRAAAGQRNGRENLNESPDWRLHDLRRTAKTIMRRKHVGVSSFVSERVLGHVIAGVEGVYDRHDYVEDKHEALDKLAAEIHRIVTSDPETLLTQTLLFPAKTAA